MPCHINASIIFTCWTHACCTTFLSNTPKFSHVQVSHLRGWKLSVCRCVHVQYVPYMHTHVLHLYNKSVFISQLFNSSSYTSAQKVTSRWTGLLLRAPRTGTRLVFRIVPPQRGCQTISRQNKHNIKREVWLEGLQSVERPQGEKHQRGSEEPLQPAETPHTRLLDGLLSIPSIPFCSIDEIVMKYE